MKSCAAYGRGENESKATPQRPLNEGGRFSRNAVRPSVKSALSKQASASASHSSFAGAPGSPTVMRIDALAALRVSGALRAMVAASASTAPRSFRSIKVAKPNSRSGRRAPTLLPFHRLPSARLKSSRTALPPSTARTPLPASSITSSARMRRGSRPRPADRGRSGSAGTAPTARGIRGRAPPPTPRCRIRG